MPRCALANGRSRRILRPKRSRKTKARHCERSEAIQSPWHKSLDCFVAALLPTDDCLLQLPHLLVGDRERRGEAGRGDREQVQEPRQSVMVGTVDQEIGGRFALT